MSHGSPMSSRERFLAALALEEPDRVPIFDWVTNRTLYEQRAGRKPVGFEGRLAVRLIRAIGLDAVWVPSGGFPGLFSGHERLTWVDDQTFRDEWGITYQESPTAWPLAFAVAHPVRNRADWQRITPPDPMQAWRLQYARDARAELSSTPGADLALVAGIRGPFSTVFMLMGLAGMSYALYDDPDLLDEMFRVAAKFWTEVGRMLLEDGLVDGLVIHEDMGSNTGTFVSPRFMRRSPLPYLREEVAQLASLGAPIILHSCGNINAIMPDLMEMQFSGLNNLQRSAAMEISGVKATYGRKICIIGNVDATNVLPYGSPAEIQAAVVDCLRIGAPGGGYILASDHSLHDGISPENVDLLIDTGRRFGAYPLALPEPAVQDGSE